MTDLTNTVNPTPGRITIILVSNGVIVETPNKDNPLKQFGKVFTDLMTNMNQGLDETEVEKLIRETKTRLPDPEEIMQPDTTKAVFSTVDEALEFVRVFAEENYKFK